MRKERIRETDFSSCELPKTRREQFIDILKHQKLNVLKISLLQTVFNAPIMVWAVFFYTLLGAAPSSIFQLTVYMALILIPCVIVANVGLTGTFYSFRKLAFGDGLFASSSFFIGMKNEWKKGIFFGLLQGLSTAIFMIGLSFVLSAQGANFWSKGFALVAIIILILTMSMINYYSLAQTAVYSNKAIVVLKNSFLFSLCRYPMHLLFLLIHPGIIIGSIIGCFCIPSIGTYVAIGVFIIFSLLNGFGLLAWMLFTLTTFDKFINKVHYPEIVGKGLYKEN